MPALPHPEFTTRICQELPTKSNPFVARERRLYGYAIDELWGRCTLSEVIYLMIGGELPTRERARLLECLMIGLSNLGPRDVGIRAAMTAGISKTHEELLLPIGLLACGGSNNGNTEIALAHRYIREHLQHDPQDLGATTLAAHLAPTDTPMPGFGSTYGSEDPILTRLANACIELSIDTPALRWGQKVVTTLAPHGHGWRFPGLVAAASLDLGFGERESIAVGQLARAPGIAAQGLEQLHHPIHHSRFLEDEHYERIDSPG